MENLPKRKRGRPRKIPGSMVDGLGIEVPKGPGLSALFEETMRTDRTRANAFYADGARDVVEVYAKQVKGWRDIADPVRAAKLRLGLDWILRRRTVLTELGRMMDADENPTEHKIGRLQDVVFYIAERHDKMTARGAAAYVRRQRLGETERKKRIESLHHALNAAINEHRRRFPESTWADVSRALEHTTGQVARKL